MAKKSESRYKKHELVITKFIKGSPDVMYDIGIGEKTEWQTLPAAYPKMKLFGCEPDPRRFTRAQLAGFRGTLWPVAIAPTKTVQIFNNGIASGPHCSDISVMQLNPLAPPVNVEAITLHEFDVRAGKPSRVLLWIDIEGYELAALRTGEDVLRSGRVGWINLEERRGTPPHENWCSAAELESFLQACGFSRVHTYNKHETHQDVIYRHAVYQD